VGHVYIVEEHAESGPAPDIHRDEGEQRRAGTAKPLQGQSVHPQCPEGGVDRSDIGFQHSGKDSAGDGYGKNGGHIQQGTKKSPCKNFTIDNICDDDAEECLGENGSQKKYHLIADHLKHDRILEEEPEIFDTDKKLISAHAVPFKEAVIEIEEKRVDAENTEENKNGNNKQIPFVLKVFLS
jgi:hypothetical protein